FPLYLFSSLHLRPPPSTPFPYTTLFRSARPVGRGQIPRRRPRRQALRRHVQRFCPGRPEGGSGEGLGRRGHPRRPEKDQSCGRRSEEHTSELQSLRHLVCRLLLEKKKKK